MSGVEDALAGERVLDLSRLLPGPAATFYLQGMGAAVDRVETPGSGDWSRHAPPFVEGVGAFFASTSRGKRSIAIHLRHPEASGLLRSLLHHYDVLVEGFRPGVLEAMGLAPERLRTEFPRLVVARISGFGQTGAYAQRVGHDLNYVALAGHLALSRTTPGIQAADFAGALAAAMGIAAALYQRERTGQGTVLDIGLAEAALTFLTPYVPGFTAQGTEPEPGAEMLSGGVPAYGTYRCKDGRYLTIGALEPRFQASLAEAVPRQAWSEEGLAEAFASRDRDEWVEILEGACSAPALDLSELSEHPHWRERGSVVRMGAASWVRPILGSMPEGPVPSVGEHTRDILAEWGIGGVDGLFARGVVA